MPCALRESGTPFSLFTAVSSNGSALPGIFNLSPTLLLDIGRGSVTTDTLAARFGCAPD